MYIRELQHIQLFKGLSEGEINCDIRGTEKVLETGDILFREGEEATFLFLVLEGTLELYRFIKGEKLTVSEFTTGTTGGEVALLGGTAHLAECQAQEPTTLFCLDKDQFWKMMGDCTTIRERILADNASRTRQLSTMSFQREKLISLGTMSAGLAHELNNPAAAARRAARNLQSTLDRFDRDSSAILSKYIFKTTPDPAKGYPFAEIEDKRQIEGVELDMITRSEREDDMADWLEELGMDDPYEMASTLVDSGYEREVMESFSEKLVPEEVTSFITWVYGEMEIHRLADELAKSTIRISDVIAAMKSYSFMGRSLEKKQSDLSQGLQDTLTLLHFKLKKKNITLKKDFDTSTPEVPVYGSEINQVWTNLLDNAIDAVDKGGRITVRLSAYEKSDTRYARVDFEDNGHGIPENIQKTVFDPFFTTKEVGKGTGLGLDISYRIVVTRHRGELYFDTGKTGTTFTVLLPRVVGDNNGSTPKNKEAGEKH
ncbi:MAG: ATP-binding protein [Cyclobacteriaceae bacterium]